MVRLILVLLTYLTVVHRAISETDDNQSYFYFSHEAKEAAIHLQKYLSDLDDKFEEYLIQLKSNNAASIALKKYNEAVSISKGTNCVSKITNDHANSQRDIEAIIETCQNIVPHTDLQTLSTKLQAAVRKVEMVDKTLRFNSKICSTEKAKASSKCIENKRNALDKLKAVLSENKKAKFEKLSKTAFNNVKNSLDSCVDGATKDLQLQVEASIQIIEDCLKSITNNL